MISGANIPKQRNMKEEVYTSDNNIKTTWLMSSYPGVVSAPRVSFVQPTENLPKPSEHISTQRPFKVQPFCPPSWINKD